jgi:hypothetical protein
MQSRETENVNSGGQICSSKARVNPLPQLKDAKAFFYSLFIELFVLQASYLTPNKGI